MAKLYGEIAAKALLTLDKSFARANGQPLDASEVYYSLAAAEAYAATAQAYIGQKIVVIENGVVTHYSVEDTAGTLKELGSKPVADGTTIEIDDNGKITLANLEGKTSGTYNAVLVNGELTWVTPSSTTVEGLSDLITALTGRVDIAEADIDALQVAVGVAAKEAVGEEGSEDYEPAVAATGLYKAVADEVARATAAEEALSDRINAIDFVDNDELTAALEPYATKTYVGEEIAKIEIPVVGVATDDKVLSLGADKLIAATVSMAYDSEAKAIKLYGKDNAELGSVDATPFIKDGMLSDVEYNADNNTLTFTWNTDSGDKTDTVVLSDIIEPYTAGNGLELAGNVFSVKLADGNESFLTVSEDGLKLSGVQDAINTAKADAIADAESKIASAKQEAIDAAASDATSKADAAKQAAIDDAASKYATTDALSQLETDLDARLDTLETYDHSTYATKDELKTTDDKAVSNANSITNLTNRLDGIVAQGGEPNTINTIKVNGVAQTIDSEKAVDITVPTKFSNLTDDSGFSDRITAAQNDATQALSDASTANAAAAQAQNEVDALETEVGNLQTTVVGHGTTISDHSTRIGALEQADITHKTEYETLNSIVSGHTSEIAKKADTTALDAAIARIASNEGAITTLNNTTIPGINDAIALKANAADVYTKSAVDAITGIPDEGKTLVQMIADAKSEASYDDTSIKALIQANTDAIAILNSDANTAGSVAKIAADAAKAEVATVVGAAPEAMNTLEEVAQWIANDESGAAAMANDIATNKTAIAAINNETTGILAVSKKYTDDAIAGLPAATADVLGLVKVDNVTIKSEEGVISVKEISTDLLVQGTQEFVLCGGTASV